MKELIATVDRNDCITGFEQKLKVHENGILHRAFSALVFNNEGKLLIQKRAKNKYHSGGLWANSCCSHLRQNEKMEDAVEKRMLEEMGFTCKMKKLYTFSYWIEFSNELWENEIDHVYIGFYNGDVVINKKEVEDFKWVNLNQLLVDVKTYPEKFAHWFKIILEHLDKNVQLLRNIKQ